VIWQFSTRKAAREDAAVGVSAPEDRIEAALGPRPALNPVGNPEHGRLVAALDRTRIDDLREDVSRLETALDGSIGPFVITAGLVALFVAEWVGAILVARGVGFVAAERIVVGCALASAVFALTALAARRAAVTSAAGSSDGDRPRRPPERSPWSWLVIGAYAVLVTAVAAVRVLGAADEEASEIQLAADALIMLAAAVGPAWLADALMRRRAAAARSFGVLRTLRRRLRQAERARVVAQAAVERIARAGSRWDVEAARRRALYRAAHRLASAARPPDSVTPPEPAPHEHERDPLRRNR